MRSRIEPVLEDHGLELVDVETKGGRAPWTLRVIVDTPEGDGRVSVERCAEVSREIGTQLDAADLMRGRYTLEVSSPGVERPLVRLRDYRRFAGREVRLKGYGPLVEGSKTVEGELLGLADEEEGVVAVRVDEQRVEVPVSSIASAHLVYDWESDL